MKNTALTHIHESLGAKMVPFAGYNMPVQYEGVNAEHEIVRNGVGVFDVSHMGEFFLKGENALALIQKVTSDDASKLVDGKAQYSCLPNNEGGIVDDLIVYKIADNHYMLVVNASNIEKTGTGSGSMIISRWQCIIFPIKPACSPFRAPMQQKYYSHSPRWIF